MLVLILSRSVQLCVDIAAHLLAESKQPVPATDGRDLRRPCEQRCDRHLLAGRLRRAIGFRNIAVLNYQTIDWNIVFVLSGKPQVDFEDFAAQVTSGL